MVTVMETSDKSLIYRYKSQGNRDKPNEEDLYCYYHNPPVKKYRISKFLICPKCRGRQIYSPSGIPVKKQQKLSF